MSAEEMVRVTPPLFWGQYLVLREKKKLTEQTIDASRDKLARGKLVN